MERAALPRSDSISQDLESPAALRRHRTPLLVSDSLAGGEQDAWLLSYLDLLTLLLVLFVVLLAFSQFAPERAVEGQSEQQGPSVDQPIADATHDDSAVADLLAELTVPELGESVRVAVSSGAVNVEISDSVLFVPASAELNGRGRKVLQRLATALAQNFLAVSVEGHTDNLPIRNARFPSNWELSSHRATAVTRYLVARGVSPGRLRAIGYAETRPKASNHTAAGRARNRRVSLVVHLDTKPSQARSAPPRGALLRG